MACFPSQYLICLEHLQTGDEGEPRQRFCKSHRDVNGGVDKEKAGQDSERVGTAGMFQLCLSVSSLQLTKGVNGSRMGMGVKL